MKHIKSYNDKRLEHGYQQYILDGYLWYRGCFKNGNKIGYQEENLIFRKAIGDEYTKVLFCII